MTLRAAFATAEGGLTTTRDFDRLLTAKSLRALGFVGTRHFRSRTRVSLKSAHLHFEERGLTPSLLHR